MAREDESSTWPYVLGGLTLAGLGGAALYFFWPSEAYAKEPPKDLTPEEIKTIRSLACLCWRGGATTAPKLAKCVAERLRPKHKWPPSGAVSDQTKRVWIPIESEVASMLNASSQAGQDLCDFIEGKAKPKPSGDGKIVRVPNVSGDPKGYNTKIFKDYTGFRNLLNTAGYEPGNIATNAKPEGNSVRRFQEDWNLVSAAVAAGKIAGPWAYKPRGFHYSDEEPTPIKGGDNVTGSQTANALEIVAANLAAGRSWQALVQQAKG